MRTKNKRTIERTQEQTNDKMKRTITRNIRTKAYLEETCLKEQTNVRMNGKQRNLLLTLKDWMRVSHYGLATQGNLCVRSVYLTNRS